MADKKIDWDKPLQTCDGRKVRVYSMHAGAEYPVHGAIYNEQLLGWTICSWTLNGEFILGIKDPRDIINVPETQLVNLYYSRLLPLQDRPARGHIVGIVNKSRDEARRNALRESGYIGTISVQDDKVVGFEVFED